MLKKLFVISLVIINVFLMCKTYAMADEISVDYVDGTQAVSANTNVLGISSSAAVLMEAQTGTILYEKDLDERVSPASITKIMTLLIIFENLENGRIALDDIVTTSEYAKSMGGSQVFLETGEQQSVETLIKCIVIASGNDASVAMAEYVAGTEENFVEMMNDKSKELGMVNTNFVDCCGLTDSDNHYTSAKDVALMSRELITKYPEIYDYSSIWMETIIHKTDRGEEEFVLSNTNKLLKMNENVTGLKTGSTSKAKYCVSATATQNDIELISVIMGASDYKSRFLEAQTLLNYGFSNCNIYKDFVDDFSEMKISCGKEDYINVEQKEEFIYLYTNNEPIDNITKKINYFEVEAPILKGDKVGEIEYYDGEKKLGSVDIVSKDTVYEANYINIFLKSVYMYFTFQ